MTDIRAVSEVVGYVIILGIVFTAIGLVYVQAIPALDSTEEGQHLQNAERSFVILQSNLDEMVDREVPRRATQMRLTDGTLSIDRDETPEGRSARVITTVTDGGTEVLSEDRGFDPVTYSIEDRSIVYENGAVLRSDGGGGSGMVEGPGWRLKDDSRFLLNIVQTTFVDDGTSSFGVGELAGRSSALIRSDFTGIGTTRNIECENDCEVNVTVVSKHSVAWESYFEREFEGSNVDINRLNSETVELNAEVDDRIIYTRKRINLGIQ